MSRLPKTTREDFPEDLHYVWDRLGGPDGPPNIFRVLGNNPALLRSYLRLGNGLWSECGLDVRTRELAILRTAILRQSTYEWHQHVRIGLDAGCTLDEINGLHDWNKTALFTPEERAMLAYIDALNESDCPPQEVHDELARYWEPRAIVGINLLTGFYAMTAKFLAAMEVETETPFVGWQV